MQLNNFATIAWSYAAQTAIPGNQKLPFAGAQNRPIDRQNIDFKNRPKVDFEVDNPEVHLVRYPSILFQCHCLFG